MVKYMELGELVLEMVFHGSCSGWCGPSTVPKRLVGLFVVFSGAELKVCG